MKIRVIFKKFLSLIQGCLILFSAGIWYLSNEKMGVMRWLVYENEIYDKFFMRGKIIGTLVLILILFIIVTMKIYKNHSRNCIFFITINLLMILFAIGFNSDKIICYFIINIIYIIILIMQLIKFIFL